MTARLLWPEYREVWCIDFEFHAPPGEYPRPLCLVGIEVHTDRQVNLWLDGDAPVNPPFAGGDDCLVVAYFAPAEWSCYLALDWPLPRHCIDLFAEFRNRATGRTAPAGHGLIGALTYFGLPAMSSEDKNTFRDLAKRGGPFTDRERQSLLRYCAEDVRATVALLRAMGDKIDLPRAVLRGRYTQAVARMERIGIPIDLDMLGQLRENWDGIKRHVVARVDSEYGVFVATDPRNPEGGLSFSESRWAEYLARKGLYWPRLPSGRLALDDDTFKEQARAHPREIGPLRDARNLLSKLRLNDLAVGADGRNRCMLSPFGTITGRNAPSNSRFAFGPSAWLRSLIRPPEGFALAYVDWSQQELALAAGLSRDPRMMDAYSSSDFYLTFAKMARAVPADATKKSHPRERERFKVTALAVLYGMGEESLARRLDIPLAYSRELLELHRRAFPRFWEWILAVENHALLAGELATCYGWKFHVGPDTRPTTVKNFLMQAHGAEMMRLACILATEDGLRICCPVHDALLLEARLERIEDDTRRLQEHMASAAALVLPKLVLKSDAKIVRYPDRYQDERGVGMWSMVTEFLAAEMYHA